MVSERLRRFVRNQAARGTFAVVLDSVVAVALGATLALLAGRVAGCGVAGDGPGAPGILFAWVVAGTLVFGIATLARSLVSERKARRRQARYASEARDSLLLLQTVAENAPLALIVTDDIGRVVHANGLANGLLGPNLVGRACREVIDERRLQCTGCPFHATEFACPEPRTASARDAPDEVVAFQAHRFDAGAGRPSVLLVGRLLTEQKRLQAQLMHRERLAMVGMMTAGIAHDLGSPLASMSAQIQRLDGGPGSPPIGDVLRDVRHEIERLSRTVRELVDFTRRQKDDAALVSVGSVAEEALRVLRHDPRARLVEFGLVVDPTTPAVDIVADHLTQVLLNLLVNAIDAMPDGGSVRVAVGPAGDKVRLTVADTGTGMSPEVLSRVFEPFFTTKQPGSGAGLGLGLSRDILAGFGATIVLESAPGRGTTAVIDIPVAATAPASPTGAEG